MYMYTYLWTSVSHEVNLLTRFRGIALSWIIWPNQKL